MPIRRLFAVMVPLVFCTMLGGSNLAAGASWEAGFATVKITPHHSLWMAGFGARTKPSQGVLLDLYAKALALRDRSGHRVVLVTTDLESLPRSVSQNVARRVQRKYGLGRNQLLFNCSHTHGSPITDIREAVTYEGKHGINAEQWAAVDAYIKQLEDKIVKVVGAALGKVQPASLSFGHGEADFAVNRREKTATGYIDGVNNKGPVDHDVPILLVRGEHGRTLGIVFGYACHNTTINGGPDFYKFSSDYAGYAQKWLEEHHPGALAMFVQGCGGDQNPFPRGTAELARQHGEQLGQAVEKAINNPLHRVNGPLKVAFKVFSVDFAEPPTRAELEGRLKSDDIYVQKHAEAMLKIIDQKGQLFSTYPYSLQVWEFGRSLTIVALAGECVVGYDLRLKKELGPDKLWIAGYSNDGAFAYIPTLQVLREGGYEGGGAMIYSGLPGPFAPSTEKTIIHEVHVVINGLNKQSDAKSATH
jgi:Neutral/alkaline non-lysosomal ceramidase, N-terminal